MPLQACFISAEAQPPLPLQEFLPEQPLSPLLQPPLPLHEFMPLQTCLSDEACALSFFSSPADDFLPSPLAASFGSADSRREPARTPATARPIACTFRSPFFIHLSFPSPSGGSTGQHRGRNGRGRFVRLLRVGIRTRRGRREFYRRASAPSFFRWVRRTVPRVVRRRATAGSPQDQMPGTMRALEFPKTPPGTPARPAPFARPGRHGGSPGGDGSRPPGRPTWPGGFRSRRWRFASSGSASPSS